VRGRFQARFLTADHVSQLLMFHSLFIPAVYVSQLPCFTAVYLTGRVFQLFIPAVHAQAGNVIQLFTSPVRASAVVFTSCFCFPAVSLVSYDSTMLYPMLSLNCRLL